MTRATRSAASQRVNSRGSRLYGFMGSEWLQVWFMACLLILSRFPDGWFGRVMIIDPPVNCLLTPDWAWQLPAAALLWKNGWALPVWEFAPLTAGMIALLSHLVSQRSGAWIGMLALAGWAWALDSQEISTLLLTLLLFPIISETRPSRRQFVLFMIWLGVCPLISLSFGMLWLVGTISMIVRTDPVEGRPSRLAPLGVLAVVALGYLVSGGVSRDGFVRAGLRTWSGFFVPPLSFPGSAPLWEEPLSRLAGNLCLILFLMLCCRETWRPRFSLKSMAIWLVTFAALTSRHALGPMSVIMCPLLEAPQRLPNYRMLPWRARLPGLAAAILLITPSLPAALFTLLGMPSPPRHVNPAAWATAGPVMLMDLNHSQEWSFPELHSKYPLLLNDRWDLFAAKYRQYFVTCREVADFQPHRRLLEDESWGGYRRLLQDWRPALAVVDVTALEHLRRFSLSTDFRLAGLDGERAIFAATNEPTGQAASAQAARAMLELEWPGLKGSGIPGNIVVAESPHDYDRVSAALIAIRLPFAGLRVLRSGPRPMNLPLQADGYLELAHRFRQQSGSNSLLDQVRALSRIRMCVNDRRVDSAHALRWARSLAALGQEHLAHELADRLQTGTLVRWFSPDIAAQASGLTRSLRLPETRDVSGDSGEETAAEKSIRALLAAGLPAEALADLAQRSADYRRYYEVLAQAALDGPDQTLRDLRTLVETNQIPQPNLGEALFYLGCLANEVGDPETAAKALLRSREVAPEIACSPLRELYLQQITGK